MQIRVYTRTGLKGYLRSGQAFMLMHSNMKSTLPGSCRPWEMEIDRMTFQSVIKQGLGGGHFSYQPQPATAQKRRWT